ncbi:hypothetical protein [Oricola cellulosilytica]|nr:hypothetical protein [Oricola cellulosilytica]
MIDIDWEEISPARVKFVPAIVSAVGSAGRSLVDRELRLTKLDLDA